MVAAISLKGHHRMVALKVCHRNIAIWSPPRRHWKMTTATSLYGRSNVTKTSPPPHRYMVATTTSLKVATTTSLYGILRDVVAMSAPRRHHGDIAATSPPRLHGADVFAMSQWLPFSDVVVFPRCLRHLLRKFSPLGSPKSLRNRDM